MSQAWHVLELSVGLRDGRAPPNPRCRQDHGHGERQHLALPQFLATSNSPRHRMAGSQYFGLLKFRAQSVPTQARNMVEQRGAALTSETRFCIIEQDFRAKSLVHNVMTKSVPIRPEKREVTGSTPVPTTGMTQFRGPIDQLSVSSLANTPAGRPTATGGEPLPTGGPYRHALLRSARP
jgi:hypothetical protein